MERCFGFGLAQARLRLRKIENQLHGSAMSYWHLDRLTKFFAYSGTAQAVIEQIRCVPESSVDAASAVHANPLIGHYHHQGAEMLGVELPLVLYI